MLKYVSLFLVFALALTLVAFASLDGRLFPDVNVRAEGAKPYGATTPAPAGALSFQHGGSAPCYALQNLTVRVDPAESGGGRRADFHCLGDD